MNMMNRGKYSGDNWALITPVDTDVEREKQGYELLDDKIIQCADCGRSLIEIIKVKEDDSIIKQIKALCPCGGSSFLFEIRGHTYLQAVEGLYIDNMPTECDGNIIKMTIEVLK